MGRLPENHITSSRLEKRGRSLPTEALSLRFGLSSSSGQLFSFSPPPLILSYFPSPPAERLFAPLRRPPPIDAVADSTPRSPYPLPPSSAPSAPSAPSTPTTTTTTNATAAAITTDTTDTTETTVTTTTTAAADIADTTDTVPTEPPTVRNSSSSSTPAATTTTTIRSERSHRLRSRPTPRQVLGRRRRPLVDDPEDETARDGDNNGARGEPRPDDAAPTTATTIASTTSVASTAASSPSASAPVSVTFPASSSHPRDPRHSAESNRHQLPPSKRARTDTMLANSDGQLVSPLSGAVNGSSQPQLQNGKGKAGARPQQPASRASPASHPGISSSQNATYFGHDREEVTRILVQALYDLGYNDAAESVVHNSGIALDSEAVIQFRRAVLLGDWDEAERLLLGATTATATPAGESGRLAGPTTNASSTTVATTAATAATATATASSSSSSSLASDNKQADRGPDSANDRNGLVLVPGADRNLMRFGIRQQKYLELLEQRETPQALSVLRTELAPLYQDTRKLHFLSTLLMCRSPDDLKETADWDGAYGQSRQLLLSQLAGFISPSVMLPEHRLAVLLGQVKEFQVAGCIYHTSATSPSLYADHYCDKTNFPSLVLHELDSHSGEVWQIRFSHDGQRLASCGSGRYVVIWDVATCKMLLKLDGHGQGVGDVAWSPDDALLVSCGRDGRARLWDTRTGLLVRLFEQFEEPISCCVWAPDGRSIVLGSFDKDRALCQWSLRGERLFAWTKTHRTEDLALAPNGQWLVAMDNEHRLHVYNYVARKLDYVMELATRAVSVAVSQDSEYLLVNLLDGEIHLYNIQARATPVRKYIGATGGECVIRSTFGGADESFVVSGSEDGKLNIWHKNIGVQLFKLDAHKPRCNAVAWSPTDPCLFATCGDDNKIKLWSNSERVRLHELEAAAHSNGVAGRSSNGWRPELSDV
ncbi:WD domain containing protein [Niveomyces insectorum RCEF 264]|uniref:WD domain containing protein n=1 Tax=Niveomyces insectorum RCEF 264 TaxID=1081102 RepID=A0A167PS75_9HYPO|nr:WD domain containing protein [Niveomyces insectorum RCEF 264]